MELYLEKGQAISNKSKYVSYHHWNRYILSDKIFMFKWVTYGQVPRMK